MLKIDYLAFNVLYLRPLVIYSKNLSWEFSSVIYQNTFKKFNSRHSLRLVDLNNYLNIAYMYKNYLDLNNYLYNAKMVVV